MKKANFQIDMIRSIPFFLMHLAVLIAFFIPFQSHYLGLCFFSYVIRMFGITAGYHRYFSHRSYRMGRIAQFLMAFLGSTATQKGVLWWAANHRHHHRYSDQPHDLHSPQQQGFWWSHVGWILSNQHDAVLWNQIPDLARYPELRWINRFHLLPAIFYASLFFLLGDLGTLIWGYVISTVLLWHGTFTINSLCHVFGKARYQTGDTSKNNFWLAILTLGEGWHNNHHCYMSSTNQGFFWWEIDPSYWVLKVLSWIGVTSQLRHPPLERLEAKRIKKDSQLNNATTALLSPVSTLPPNG